MIIDIIKKDLNPPHIEDVAINTLAIMEEYNTSILPVVNGDNKLLGLIEAENILNMEDLQKTLHFVKNKFKNISTLLHSHIFQNIQILSEHNISMLPVTNLDNNYIGYITAKDIITKIGGHHDIDNSTSILVISINRKDYVLSEITRLVEENSGKIMSLWVESKEEKLNLHLLITCPNSESVMQSLERYDYHILATFLKDTSPRNLDDRFESFIKYLNT